MKYTYFLLLIFSAGLINAQDFPSNEEQINGALQAAPADVREGATVMGYNPEGKLVVLKKGSNDMICLADDPSKKGFNAACYPSDLEPFMRRGRELRAEGKNREEIFEIREKEAKAGTLPMPKMGTTLHILYGTDGVYNSETGKVENVNYRYVVYIPWATPESTGLPLSPMVKGGPWIMDPGTHRAHIMISPPWPEN